MQRPVVSRTALAIGLIVASACQGAPPSSPAPSQAGSIATAGVFASPSASATGLASPSPATSESPRATQFQYVRFLASDVVIFSEPGGDEDVGSTQPDQHAAVLERANVGEIEWIRVQIGSLRTDYPALYGWVPRAADVMSDGRTVHIDPVYEPAPPICPHEVPTLTDVAVMLPALALDCYGSDELKFSPVQVRRMFSDEGEFVTGRPPWLALGGDLWLFDSHEGNLTNSMWLHVDPASDLTVPTDTWLEVEGKFDHPASTTCDRSAALPHLAIANRDEAVLWCRERFVVSAFRVLPASERPPTPEPRPTPGPPASRAIDVTTDVITAPILPRFEASGVWTGSEAIVWGGTDMTARGNGLLSDGAAYNPETDRWRVIRPGPLTERSAHLAVWTGTEMLIWGGHRANYIEPPDGAAYDPETDRWREMADGPLEWEPNAAGAWTGIEWVIAATSREDVTKVAAYDPAADTWRTLPSIDAQFGHEKHLIWADAQLILLDQSARLSRLPDEAGEWIAVAPLRGGFPVYPTVEWTGVHVIGIASQFLGTDQPRYWQFLVGWDPNSDTWPSLPAAPANLLSADRLVWADGRAILLGADLAYDAESQAWWDMPTPTWDDRYDSVILWAGDRLFVWGGGEGDEIPAAYGDGLVLTPDW